MTHVPPVVDTPGELIALRQKFPHFFKALHGKGPVRIAAMGSSSTAGRADVAPYPARLEMYLRWQYQERFPDLRIDVLNRGKGGEEAPEELKRFKTDIFNEKPSLVMWQVGTTEQMVSLIAAAAESAEVSLFRRWALMRHWHIHNNVARADMIDPSDPDSCIRTTGARCRCRRR